MRATHLTGPGAAATKYDILTALSVAALHGTAVQQTSVLRLIALVTARYNWTRNEMSIGQRDMARIWGVEERTAKREVKRLTGAGLIACVRPGVRGRVAAYRLDLAGIEAFSQDVWDHVGPDFAERIGTSLGSARTGRGEDTPAKVVAVDFGMRGRSVPPEATDPWGRVMADLARSNPETYSNWFSRLRLAGQEGGTFRITAPNGFLRDYVATHLQDPLGKAIAAEFGTVTRLVIETAG